MRRLPPLRASRWSAPGGFGEPLRKEIQLWYSRYRSGSSFNENMLMTGYPILNGFIFAGLGILVFFIAFAIAVKLTPVDLWKEIVEHRNVAAAILAGAAALGLAWIIAAAMH